MENGKSARLVRFCEHTVQRPAKVGGIATADWVAARLAAGAKKAERWFDADLSIMHVTSLELAEIERNWRGAETRRSMTIVRVTEGGRDAFETAEDLCWKEGNQAAYVLHARNHQALETQATVREAVLSMSLAQAIAIYEGSLEGLPRTLRQAFEAPGTLTILPALAVLCQGYLCLQPSDDPTVSLAQSRMGWNSRHPANNGGGRPNVVSPQYWNVLLRDADDLAGSRRALLMDVQADWGDAASGSEPVKALIATIGGEIGSPVLVARAYLALAERLGCADDV